MFTQCNNKGHQQAWCKKFVGLVFSTTAWAPDTFEPTLHSGLAGHWKSHSKHNLPINTRPKFTPCTAPWQLLNPEPGKASKRINSSMKTQKSVRGTAQNTYLTRAFKQAQLEHWDPAVPGVRSFRDIIHLSTPRMAPRYRLLPPTVEHGIAWN